MKWKERFLKERSISSLQRDKAWEQAKEGFSEVVDGRAKVKSFVFVLENMSSSNLTAALAVSISSAVNNIPLTSGPSCRFGLEVECHFMEQKLQPRSVFIKTVNELEGGTLFLAIDPMMLHRNVRTWMYRVCGGFTAEWLDYWCSVKSSHILFGTNDWIGSLSSKHTGSQMVCEAQTALWNSLIL